jgi:predicted MFS family arabinose efflux permease
MATEGSRMNFRDYGLVTAAYWGFTVTDGALRMLVLLHFHSLGYSPLQIASLFLLYELCGVLTNLFGGWAGSRVGLRATLFWGLALQVVALVMLSLVRPGWAAALSVGYVMASQALSGVAKDLTKMSAKSAVKLLVPAGDEGGGGHLLFKWVAVLTGSKNALKGVGFFLGGALLGWAGFAPSLWLMAAVLAVVLLVSLFALKTDMGKSKRAVRFAQVLSKSREINLLSAARFFLFGARDVWFAVALPLFLTGVMGWRFWETGAFMAAWVIGYGIVQASAPALVGRRSGGGAVTGARSALAWGLVLAVVTAAIAAAVGSGFHPAASVLGGLAVFGLVFAINSAVHSYLVLAYTDADKVALDVGFYYMANAWGRLAGTFLSGLVYLHGGLAACLWVSAGMVLAAALLAGALPRK